MDRTDKLAEGKTKIIWEDPDRDDAVLIESKDDITAGDGAKHDVLDQKGTLATTTTVNCFQLLTVAGIPNHFIEQVDERTFRAQRVRMIPIEIVMRGVATGSYLKRNPGVVEGWFFRPPIVEFFYKDDNQHDPLLIFDSLGWQLLFFDAKKPLQDGLIRVEHSFVEDGKPGNPWTPLVRDLSDNGAAMENYGVKTFLALQKAWDQQGVTLCDLKIECGINCIGQLVVADVIDNDSWRLWPGGHKGRMLDKQVYRNLDKTTPDALRMIQANYAQVAQMSGQFATS